MNFFQFLFKNPIYILVMYLSIMTLVTFFVMGLDKHFARKGSRRVSESALFLLCIVGGSVGGIVGMYVFHHKTLHKTFTFGLPVILILQIALGVLIAVVAK
ncbi:MAG: DUF1294 domain-containing protein [Oscillospiraceae bacterium]